MKEKGFCAGCFCIHITAALFVYNAFFWIGYPAYPRSIADVKPIRLLENLSTTSVDVLHIVGMAYETQILSPFPFVSKHDFVIIVFIYNRGQGRHLFQGPAYISTFVRNAIDNAKRNKINNIEFHCRDAGEFIEQYDGDLDIVIMDPPRKGSDEKFLSTLINKRIKQIIYVSCDPETLSRDLAFLSKTYTVNYVQPVDMFPMTSHVETVVELYLK